MTQTQLQDVDRSLASDLLGSRGGEETLPERRPDGEVLNLKYLQKSLKPEETVNWQVTTPYYSVRTLSGPEAEQEEAHAHLFGGTTASPARYKAFSCSLPAELALCEAAGSARGGAGGGAGQGEGRGELALYFGSLASRGRAEASTRQPR